MLKKIASNYLDKEADWKAPLRRYNNGIVLPAGSMPANATATDYALKIAKSAEYLRSRPDAGDWRETGKIPNIIRSEFAGKGKCNVLPAATMHHAFGKNKKNIMTNSETGRLMTANQMYDLIKPGPWKRQKFDGQVINVPENLRPYALGAVHVAHRPDGHGHAGIITAPFNTTSAATAKGIVRNNWGYRPENNPSNTQAAYILPKNVNSQDALNTAKSIKYIDDNTNLLNQAKPFKPFQRFMN